MPAEYAEIPYPAEVVAKCYFRTNGSFACVGGRVWSDTFWEGLYSGSLNSAFELGLDRWYFTHVPRPTTTTTTTTTTERVILDGARSPSGRRWPIPTGEAAEDDYERSDNRRRQNRPGNDVGEAEDENDDDSNPARQRRPISSTGTHRQRLRFSISSNLKSTKIHFSLAGTMFGKSLIISVICSMTFLWYFDILPFFLIYSNFENSKTNLWSAVIF